MDGSLIAIVGVVLALIALDLAALRFGTNSRTGEREFPIGTAPDLVRRPGRRRRKTAADEDLLVVTKLLILRDAGSPVVELRKRRSVPTSRSKPAARSISSARRL